MDSSIPKRLSKRIVFVLIIICLSACSKETQTENDQSSASKKTLPAPQINLKENKALDLFLAKANTAFSTLTVSAKKLRKAVSIFIDKPTEQQLKICQDELEQTHLNYIATYLYRNTLILAKIEHPELDKNRLTPEIVHSNNSRLDKHPIIPGYIDSVDGYPSSGIIFSEQEITINFINKEHQFSDEAYVTLGFHALGYLLRGGEKETRRDANSFSSLNQAKTLEPEYRRSVYTKLIVELIIKDIALLSKAWLTSNDYYQRSLKELSAEQFNTLIELTLKLEENTLTKAGPLTKENNHYLSHESEQAIDLRRSLLNSLQTALSPP